MENFSAELSKVKELTEAHRNFSTLVETFLPYVPEENKICKNTSTDLQKLDNN